MATTQELGEAALRVAVRFWFSQCSRGPEGKLFFLDFEYAGWDDPAKMICDFFCQPKVPAPFECFEQVAGALGAGLGHSESLRAVPCCCCLRTGSEWCCILLNEFVPVDAQCQYATQANGERKSGQLSKARHCFALARR